MITEIARFRATQAYLSNRNLLDETARKLLQVPGLLRLYLGFEIEDPKTAYLVNIWESHEHYTDAAKQPSYAETFKTFQPALDGAFSDIDVSLIPFTTEPDDALSAPVTEIVYISLQSGRDENDIRSQLAIMNANKCLQTAQWGRIYGKENRYAMIIGWKSREWHYQAIREGRFNEVLEKSSRLWQNPWYCHAKLTRFTD